MKIFDNKKPKARRSSRKKKGWRNLSDSEISERATANKSKLHPMSYSLLALNASGDRPSEWISDTFNVLNNRPHTLSEKWINSINKWTEQMVSAMSLDEPDIPEGERVPLGPYKIMKILPPKMDTEYPTFAIMSVDDRGWKWYFKTSKASSIKEGEYIRFVATISAHKEGITFLKRASKIESVAKIIEERGDF